MRILLRVKVAAIVPTYVSLPRIFIRPYSRLKGGAQKNRHRLFVPSPEQEAIVKLSRTHNVVVSARPGSGKTATAEAIVVANRDRRIAVITYSKRLQIETARRLQGYDNCDVYTFHGMATKLFAAVTYNDSVLRYFRNNRVRPKWRGRPYDIVILDELQDCTEDLFWLTCTFVSSITQASDGRGPQIVALGDERQAIYSFRGADARYLSHAPETLGPISPYPWTHLPLSKSFRLSKETSRFVNKTFLGGENYIFGSNRGPKPIYIHANPFDVVPLAEDLLPLIRKYTPQQTAILAPFLRNNEVLARLTNHLSANCKIGVAVSISDDVPLDDLVIGGKVCVSTYHQFKGNERDLVIVYGVDAGYFDFLGRDLPDDRCPNETFVALTRAKKQLVIVQSDDNTPMPFISVPNLLETADIIDHADTMQPPRPVGRPRQMGLLLPRHVFVSDMARHIPDDILDTIVHSEVIIHKVTPPLPPTQHINAPDIVLSDATKGHYEAVSDLNGLAVVAAYEYALRRTLATVGSTQRLPRKVTNDPRAYAVWFCREACRYEAKASGYMSRHIQMANHDFDWLVPYLKPATSRLTAQFHGSSSNEISFEVPLAETDFYVQDQKTMIRGRADIIHHTPRAAAEHVSIWEIKFVSQLSLAHVVQVCAYAYLWCMKLETDVLPRMVLFNIRDGEKWEIEARNGLMGLRTLLEGVLEAKYSVGETVTTEAFLESCAKVREEVLALWAEGGRVRDGIGGRGGFGGMALEDSG